MAFEDREKAIQKILAQSQSIDKKQSLEIEKQYSCAIKRKKELEQIISKIYSDWISGILTEENFRRIISDCQAEQKKQDAVISEYENSNNQFQENLLSAEKAVALLEKYYNISELTAPMLNELIEKIVICEVEKIEGKPTQIMEIYFRFPYIEKLG